ncbi:unnamed protein product [Phytomonas sp. EM1]|nr:unnamed protein product [Phytomonas sp. EM1]|eukprot:CCW63555.1 unnamed protein product [Phytomonas sp. isolate EM1]
MDDELAYKIIVLGSVSVGKSNITCRFCDNKFYSDIVPTLGMDFKYTSCETLETKPRSVRLQIWDTSGQDQFVTLTTAFYRNCQGAMMCFDLSNRTSFDDLDTWYNLLEQNCAKLPLLILVGCKLDLVQSKLGDQQQGLVLGSNRQVSKSEGDAWARSHNCLCYIETSAKENTNVTQAFQQLVTFMAKDSKLCQKNTSRNLSGGGGMCLKQDKGSKEGRGSEKKSCCN